MTTTSDTGAANVEPTPAIETVEATSKERMFPSIYDEAIEISFMGVLVSGIAELRRLAREGITIGDDDILSLPFTGAQLKRFFRLNKDIVHGKMREKDFMALVFILESDSQLVLHEYLAQGALHHMGDEHANEECVYCITTNPVRKRLTLTFRGSITIQDWLQDTKALMAELPNPLADEEDQPETVGVHFGFREYLYNNAPSMIGSAIGNVVDLTASAVTKTTKSIRKGAEMTGSAVVSTGNTIKHAGESMISKTTETVGNLTHLSSGVKSETTSVPDATVSNPKASDKSTEVMEETALDPEVTEPTTTLDPEGTETTTLKPTSTEMTMSSMVGKITAPISHVASKLAWKSSASSDDEMEPSKVELIMSKLQALLDELGEDYTVYISGHSLGGALALIFAMEAAVQLRTPFPVTVFALGNPRTGNIDFRKVMCTLEEKRKLRCLCIHNQGDLVPMLPEILTTCGYLCACKRSSTFRHVGMKMKISDKTMTLKYHTSDNESFQNDLLRQRRNICGNLTYIFDVRRWCSPSTSFSVARHFYQEYIVRLQTLESQMEGIYIDDLYEKAYATSTTA